jgi:hypothetical protein
MIDQSKKPVAYDGDGRGILEPRPFNYAEVPIVWQLLKIKRQELLLPFRFSRLAARRVLCAPERSQGHAITPLPDALDQLY